MMDHLTATLRQFCDLLALDNVDTPSEGAEVMSHPAVRDLVIDVAGPLGVLRYRVRLKQAASAPSDKALIPQALAVDLHFVRRGKALWTTTGEIQACSDGIAVECIAPAGFTARVGEDEIRQKACEGAYAWMEFNFLLLHAPTAIRSWRQPATAEQRKMIRADHHGGAGAKKIYVRMFRLPDRPEAWEELRPARPQSERTRHCDAWGVRGHWREYKSGRRVYIAPYAKGARRADYAGREYELIK